MKKKKTKTSRASFLHGYWPSKRKRLVQTITMRGRLSNAMGGASLTPCVISIRDRLRTDGKIGVLISALDTGQTMSAWIDRKTAEKLAKKLPQLLEG